LKNDNSSLEEVPESLEKDGFNEPYNEAFPAWLHHFRSLNILVLLALVKNIDLTTKKSILWEIHIFEASPLKILTHYSSIQKLYFLNVSAT